MSRYRRNDVSRPRVRMLTFVFHERNSNSSNRGWFSIFLRARLVSRVNWTERTPRGEVVDGNRVQCEGGGEYK